MTVIIDCARLVELASLQESLEARRDSIIRKLEAGSDAVTGVDLRRTNDPLREVVAELESMGFPEGRVPVELLGEAALYVRLGRSDISHG